MDGNICDWRGEFLSNGYDIVEGSSGEMLELCPQCYKEHEEQEKDGKEDEELEEAQEIYCRIYSGCKDCGW